MVDLPEGPRRGINVSAPQSSLTSRDIVGPALAEAQAAENLAKAADNAVTEVGAPLVKEAGTRSITRDDQGNVVVDSMPMFGKLGDVYRASQEHAYVAATDLTLKDDLAGLARKAMLPKEQGGGGGDPEWFRTEADAYVKRRAGNQRGGFQSYVLDQGMEVAGQFHRNLMGQKFQQDTEGAKNTLKAQISDQQDTLFALARQGGTATPEYQQAVLKLQAAYTTLSADPRFGVTKEMAESEMRGIADKGKAFGVVGMVDRTFDKQGRATAQKILTDEILNDPSKQLSDTERTRLYSWGMSRLEYLSGERKAEIDGHRAYANVVIDQLRARMPLAPGVVDDAMSKAQKLGDAETVLKLDGAQRAAAAVEQTAGMNDDQRLRSLMGRSGSGGGVGYGAINVTYDGPLDRASNPSAPSPQGMYGYLISQGATRNEALMLTSAAASESGLNPFATHDGGKGLGLFGHNGSRLQMMIGLSGSSTPNWQQQAAFALKELRTRPEAAAVNAAKTPEELTAAQMAFEQPQGYVPGRPEGGHNFNGRLGTTRRFWALDGSAVPVAPIAQAGGALGMPFSREDVARNPWLGSEWLRQQATDENGLTQTATRVGDAIVAGVKAGQLPNPETLGAFFQAADRNPEKLGPKRDAVMAEMMGYDAASKVLSLPEGQARPIIEQAQQLAANAPLLEQAAARSMQQHYEEGVKQLKENPGAEAARRGWIKEAPPPLDLSSQDGIMGGLGARAAVAARIGSFTGDPSQPAFSPNEIGAVKSLLSVGTPEQRTVFFQALSKMPDAVRNATLQQIAQQPNGAVFAFAGGLSEQAPDVAESIIQGQNAIKADPKFVPSAGQDKLAYETQKTKALPLTAFNKAARMDPNGPYAAMSAAVDARYAYLSATSGDASGTANPKRLDQAVNDVTGGLVSHNGQQVIAPFRGATQEDFDGILAGVGEQDMAGVTTGNGTPVTPDFLRSSAKLHALGQGTYLVQLNLNDDAPLYASRHGRPFVLDLNNREKAVVPNRSVVDPFTTWGP